MYKINDFTTLDKVKRGEKVLVCNFLDSEVKCLSARFGVDEGQDLTCISKTPGGPVIIQKNFQEIALGKALSQKIQVKKL